MPAEVGYLLKGREGFFGKVRELYEKREHLLLKVRGGAAGGGDASSYTFLLDEEDF